MNHTQKIRIFSYKWTELVDSLVPSLPMFFCNDEKLKEAGDEAMH